MVNLALRANPSYTIIVSSEFHWIKNRPRTGTLENVMSEDKTT
jgi:hypothetical protein